MKHFIQMQLILSTWLSLASLCFGNPASFEKDFSGGKLVKDGMYYALGTFLGYYNYNEVDEFGSPFMRMDTAIFGLSGQVGIAAQNGLKAEGAIKIGYALGLYSGSILDVDNQERNGQRLYSITGTTAGDMELKAGYNLLKLFGMHSASLYLQSGVGYYITRTEFIVMDRVQGYLYVPIELEGEAQLNQDIALSYGGGYRFFALGNHFSAASKYGVEDDYFVLQRQGFGAFGFIGINYLNTNRALRSVRLVYEYWSIGAADPMLTTSSYTGAQGYIYEPKNSTHRVLLQYSFGF